MNQMRTTRRAVFAGIEGDLSGDISIDVNSIPDYARNDLARFALSLVEECFSKPGAEERYQKWLKERKKRLSANTVTGGKRNGESGEAAEIDVESGKGYSG